MTRFRSLAQILTALEIYPIALATAGALVVDDLLLPTLALLLLYWPLRWMATGQLTVRTPVDWPALLLVAAVPVTLWATALPEVTRPQVLRLLVGIGLLYSLVNWSRNARRLRLLLQGLLLAGLGLALAAPFVVQWKGAGRLPFIPSQIYDLFPARVADMVNPNVMGGVLILFIPLAAALLLFTYHRLAPWERLLALVGVPAMTGVLLLTQSRGALLGLVAAGVVLVALRWRWGWMVVPAGLLGGALVFGRLGLGALLDSASSQVAVSGLEQRIEIWSRALYMIQDFAFTGIGMGSFREVVDLLYPLFLTMPGEILHSHNLFLQVAVDLGIPGLIAWLAVLFLVLLAGWQVHAAGRREPGADLALGLGAGILAGQVAMMAHGMTDAVVWGMTRPALLVWAVWGLALAGQRVYPRGGPVGGGSGSEAPGGSLP